MASSSSYAHDDTSADMAGIADISIEQIFGNILKRRGDQDPEHKARLLVLEATRDTLQAQALEARSQASAAATTAAETTGKKKTGVKGAANAAASAAEAEAEATELAAESPAAYFCAFLVALDSSYGPARAKQLFFLLSVLMPYLSPALLRTNYDKLSRLCTSASGSSTLVKDAVILRPLLSVMGITIRSGVGQDADAWSRPEVSRLLLRLLSFTLDERPKVRKAAQEAACDLLAAHHTNRTEALPAPAFASFLGSVLRGSSQKEQTVISQTIPFLKSVLPLLPEAQVTNVLTNLLPITALGQPRLTSLVFECLTTLLESPRARLSNKFVVDLLQGFLDGAPSPEDHGPAEEFAYLTAAALTRLANGERLKAGVPREVALTFARTGIAGRGNHNNNNNAATTTTTTTTTTSSTTTTTSSSSSSSAATSGTALVLPQVCTMLPAAVSCLLRNFESSRVAVHHATANALAIILVTCVDVSMVNEAKVWAAAHADIVQGLQKSTTIASNVTTKIPSLFRLVLSLDELVHPRYQSSWSVSLPTLAVLYRILGPDSCPLMNRITSSLVSIRDAVSAASEAAEDARFIEQEEEEDEEDERRRQLALSKTGHRRDKNTFTDGPGSDDEDGGNNNGGRRNGGGGRRVGFVGIPNGGGTGGGDDDGGRGGSRSAAPVTFIKHVLMKVMAAALRAIGALKFVQIVGLSNSSMNSNAKNNKSTSSSSTSTTSSTTSTSAVSTAKGVAESRMWVLPLLRDNAQYAPTPFSFFLETILPLIREEDAAFTSEAKEKKLNAARMHRARVVMLWSLLPSLVVACPDFSTGFSSQLGKSLNVALTEPRYPELRAIVGRTIETIIVRNRAAAGLPPVQVGLLGNANNGDGDDDDDNNNDNSYNFRRRGKGGAAGADAALTVAGGGNNNKNGKKHNKNKGNKRDQDDFDIEEELDEDDNEEYDEEYDNDDGANSTANNTHANAAVGAGGGRYGKHSNSNNNDNDDGDDNASEMGATTVFGAGGVSVYAGGSGNPDDPRHGLLIQALSGGDGLPPIPASEATANLTIIAGFAKDYVPVFFSAYETSLLGYNPMSTTVAAAANIPAEAQISKAIANERSRKLFDAIVAYVSISPPAFLAKMCERLLQLLTPALESLSAAQEAALAARAAHSSASAGAKQAAATTVSSANASVRVVADRVCSLLTLALTFVPSLPSPASAEAAAADEEGVLAKLYIILKPAVADDEHVNVQKRAYDLLGAILTHHPYFAVAVRDDVMLMLRDSLLTVNAPARRGRLVCMSQMVKLLDLSDPEQVAVYPSVLSEMLICCRDGKKRVRQAAFALVFTMARRMYAVGGEGVWRGLGGSSSSSSSSSSSTVSIAPLATSSATTTTLSSSKSGRPHPRGGNGGARIQQVDLDMDADVDATALEFGGAGGGSGGGNKKKKKKGRSVGMSAEDENDDDDDDNEEQGGGGGPVGEPSLAEFFLMVIAGFTSDDSHMRSSTLLALGSLLYKFNTIPVVHAILPSILEPVLMLMRDTAREVVVSVVSFVKVAVSCMPPQELYPFLPNIISSLLVQSSEKKERIKSKVREVLERLVRKFSFDEIHTLVKESSAADEPLMTHMRKEASKKAKSKALAAAEAAAAASNMAGGDGATSLSRRRGGGDGGGVDGEDNDDDEEDDDDGSGGGGGGRSVVSGASKWKGTLSRSADAMTTLGGPGSRLGGITATMRANSVILQAAAHALPAVGSVVDPSVYGHGGGGGSGKSDRLQQQRTVISKLVGGGGAGGTVLGNKTVARSGIVGTSGRPSRAIAAPTMLLADDKNPMDLLDQSGIGGAVVGSDARTQAAIARKNSAAKNSSASALFQRTKDGRFIIPKDEDDEDDNQGGGDNDDSDDSDDAKELMDKRALKRARARAAAGGGAGGGGDLDGDDDLNGAGGKKAADEAEDNGEKVGKGAKSRSFFAPPVSKAKYDPVGNQGWGMKKGGGGASVGLGRRGGGGGGGGAAQRHSGAQYQGKGRGDVMAKKSGSNTLQPHAYVPLGGGGGGTDGGFGGGRFSAVMASTSRGARANFKKGIVAESNNNNSSKNAHGKRGRD